MKHKCDVSGPYRRGFFAADPPNQTVAVATGAQRFKQPRRIRYRKAKSLWFLGMSLPTLAMETNSNTIYTSIALLPAEVWAETILVSTTCSAVSSNLVRQSQLIKVVLCLHVPCIWTSMQCRSSVRAATSLCPWAPCENLIRGKGQKCFTKSLERPCKDSARSAAWK